MQNHHADKQDDNLRTQHGNFCHLTVIGEGLKWRCALLHEITPTSLLETPDKGVT